MNKKPSPKETEILEAIHNFEINFKRRKFKFDKKQQDLLSLIDNERNQIVFISGVAGSSKTYLAVYSALLDMQKSTAMGKKPKDILYVRSVVESASKSMGALPGDLTDKFSPFLLPLEEKLEEMLNYSDIGFLKRQKMIEATPVNFLRGASWNKKFVIIDEAQNLDHKELLTLLSRIGKECKVIICGDPMQSDINGKSGFQDFFDLFDDEDSRDNGVQVFEFSEKDIYRSEIVKFIVKKIKKL